MWKIFNTYDWEKLKNEFSWIRDMEGVVQDPIYHAEGDVVTHTKMVIDQLVALAEFKLLQEQDQHILIAAALLHDVEKRSTTLIEEDGRITSRSHAKKGESTSRHLLYTTIETPYYIREAIAKLVRYHGLPLWTFEKEDPAKAVISASLEVNTFHLYILCKADVLGRICNDQEDLLYKLELYKELCIDQECWGNARHFTNGYSKFYYLNNSESAPSFDAFDETKFEVILLSALPGSGKDSFIARSNYKNYSQVSLDNIRRELSIDPTDTRGNGKVVQAAKEMAREYMRKKKSFVWNATNTTKAMREQLIDLFVSYGGKVRIIYIEVPYKKLLHQNNDRTYAVPSNVLHKLIGRLEIPSPSEAHEVKYLTY